MGRNGPHLPLPLGHVQCYRTQQVPGLTNDVVAAMRAGVVLQKPRVHTLPVEPMSAGNDTQLLWKQTGAEGVEAAMDGAFV